MLIHFGDKYFFMDIWFAFFCTEAEDTRVTRLLNGRWDDDTDSIQSHALLFNKNKIRDFFSRVFILHVNINMLLTSL